MGNRLTPLLHLYNLYQSQLPYFLLRLERATMQSYLFSFLVWHKEQFYSVLFTN